METGGSTIEIRQSKFASRQSQMTNPKSKIGCWAKLWRRLADGVICGMNFALVLVQFEVARASCPCEFMAKMAMPLQTEPVPPLYGARENRN
jgi:hypothetical protein